MTAWSEDSLLAELELTRFGGPFEDARLSIQPRTPNNSLI